MRGQPFLLKIRPWGVNEHQTLLGRRARVIASSHYGISAMTKEPDFDLTDAYAVETPQDSVQLYREWAQTYDTTFAGQRGYCYPESLAETFTALATEQDTPVLDVGAGTGLVAKALRKRSELVVDAIDISSEMLGIS